MSRKRVEIGYKNQTVSISLPKDQIEFLNTHPYFNLSKYVQLLLSNHVSLEKQVEQIAKEEGVNIKEVIL